MNEMIPVMGLWENTDKNGNKYLTGNIGNVRVLVFKNTYKTESKHPDYNLSVTKKEIKKEENFDEGGNAF